MLKLSVCAFLGAVLLIATSRVLSKDMSHEYYLSLFSETEKDALASLRNLASVELKDDYTKEDYYLARWLLAKNFKVSEALEGFRKNLEWRDEQNISTILKEDWSDMQANFPYSRETFDVEGRPIVYFDVGQYDVASYLSDGGTTERFIRYFAKVHEESNVHLRQLRSQGKDVNQLMLIFDFGDFSLMRQGCVQCLQMYREFCLNFPPNYPFESARTVFVNTPYLMKAAYSVFTDDAQKAIEVYGQDRDQWESMLAKFVHPDQFPAGLKVDKESPQKDNSEGLLPWNEEL